MPPTLALILWLVLLLGLLIFDPARERAVSVSLWVPVTWLFIVGSRLPSQWLGGKVGVVAQAMEEGNPLDRSISFGLIVVSLIILLWRSFKWGDFFARNLALVLFLAYAMFSIVWSDFAFVAFKRWFRDLGNYLMILVVLSDPRPLEALRTVLRRLSYLLIPLSVLLIKYYPQIGVHYEPWTGSASFDGATTSKNMLGATCLVSGLVFFWDTLVRWADRREALAKRTILVNVVFIGMVLWLLNLANSATSRVCLVIGCLVIVIARSKWAERHPTFLKAMIPASFFVYLILAFGLNLNGSLASEVGRDPTLTDRTAIWHIVLGMHTNPFFGTGYESFWLGPRLQDIWQRVGNVNESHNGYLEVYLDLGLIGLALFVGFLLSSYWKICKAIGERPNSSDFLSFNLALWIVTLFYNMTEAAVRGSLVWLSFLLVSIVVSMSIAERAHMTIRNEDAGSPVSFARIPRRRAV